MQTLPEAHTEFVFSVTGWLWLVVALQGVAVLLALLARVRSGQPIWFTSVPDALFQERMASGNANDTWWRRLGSVNNCLVVALTRERLIVRPWFPFNLVFPRALGVETDVLRSAILSVTPETSFRRKSLRVRFTKADGSGAGDISLLLKKPDEFRQIFGK